MFWSKKEKGGLTGNYSAPIFNIPPPSKKEFCRMREILKDAEKYDDNDDISARDVLLKILQEQIEEIYTKTL